MDDADAPRTVDLAQEPGFVLGGVEVTPATRTIAAGPWSQRLEPRAMQVLVVLARASPAVVGRAALNTRIWGGRIVGEDAINRAVQTLRRAAAEAPGGAPFAIETIPRVGYRLTAAPAGAAPPQPEPPRPGRLPTDGPLPGAASIPAGDAAADPIPPHASRRPGDARIRRAALATAAAGVVAVTAAVGWHRAGRPPAEPDWRIVASAALDDLPPGARDATLSPDGRRLAYRGEDAHRRGRIFVRAVDGGGIGEPVSPASIDAWGPAWRGDGARLAFTGAAAGQPCDIYVATPGEAAVAAGRCETSRRPALAWSGDGGSLWLCDAPGWNAVPRITAIRIADGHRAVLTSPPGDSMGDWLPQPLGGELAFKRSFSAADEAWAARDPATGRERMLWHRRGVSGSVAAPLGDGALAIAWTRSGESGVDIVGRSGRTSSVPTAAGMVAAISAAGGRLLIETDHVESELVRGGGDGAPMPAVRGRLESPAVMPDGTIRVAIVSAGRSQLWRSDGRGSLRRWGPLAAARIVGLAPSPDGRFVAAEVVDGDGISSVIVDAAGRPVFRWNPHARILNPPAWVDGGRGVIVPMLDGAGWRLFALDPAGRSAPRDLDLPGFALVQARGNTLYAIRAGETTGVRELWRLDGDPRRPVAHGLIPRRLPIDTTLADIVNWLAVDEGVWLPDRRDPDHPRLRLYDGTTGAVLRSVAAPGLATSGTGLTADGAVPIYVRVSRDAPDHALLTLRR